MWQEARGRGSKPLFCLQFSQSSTYRPSCRISFQMVLLWNNARKPLVLTNLILQIRKRKSGNRNHTGQD